MSITEIEYDQLVNATQTTDFINAAEAPLEPIQMESSAGFFETAGLVYQQEAVIGSTLAYGFSRDRDTNQYTFDRNFNPYAFWDSNKEEFADVESYLRVQKFHDVVNEDQFRDRAKRLRSEIEDRTRIANGSGFGMLAGAGLSIIDIGTLVPIGGWFQKGNTLAKVSKMALAGGVYTGAQEALLHMQQDLRTTTESIMNIGFGSVIGGGIGVYKSARDPSSRLHPGHPESPFHPDKPMMIGFNKAGKKMSESVVVKPVMKAGKKTFEIVKESPLGSVGAAAVKKGQKVVGKSMNNPIVRTLGRAIPAIDMAMSRSKYVQDLVQKLVDTGGVLTEAMERGQAQMSIEDLAERLMYTFELHHENALVRFQTLLMNLAELQGKQGDSAVEKVGRTVNAKARQAKRFAQDVAMPGSREKGTANDGGLFEDFEFNDLTYKQLFDDIGEEELENLRGRFGDDGATEIQRVLKENAEELHSINQRMEDLMVEKGMIREDQRMGRDYGLAQLYNPRAFRGSANRTAAIKFFTEKFLDDPSLNPEWLEETFGLTVEQFQKLGKEEVKISNKVPQSSNLKDWFGESVAVKDDGSPLPLAHGGPIEITEFTQQTAKVNRSKGKLEGFYFTNPEEAAGFAGDGGVVTEVFLKLEKPLRRQSDEVAPEELRAAALDALEKVGPNREWAESKLSGVKTSSEIVSAFENAGVDGAVQQTILKKSGYDGMIDGREYVVFEPTQIKSTANPGTFDPNDPRILDQGNLEEVFSIERGVDQRLEVLEEWSGDTQQRLVRQAEQDLDMAVAAEHTARREAIQLAAEFRSNTTKITKATVEEARAILKEKTAVVEKRKLEREALQLEAQQTDNEMRRLEAELDARMNQFHDTGKFRRKYTKERASEVEQTEDLLSTLEKEGAPTKDIRDARTMLTEADIALENVGEDALNAAVIQASHQPIYNTVLAKLRGRKEVVTKRLNKLNKELEKLEPKVDALSEAVESATVKKKAARDAGPLLRKMQKEKAKIAKAARKDVKKAKKSLKKTEAQLPVHEYVRELVDKLGKQTKIPRGVLETEVFASGRTKDRQINYTNKERREAVRLGLLRNDIFSVMHSAHKDLSTRLAMREIFDTEQVSDIVRRIEDDFDQMIVEARRKGRTEKHIKSLDNEKTRMIEKTEGLWDRHLGVHALPEDPDSFIIWGMEKLRSLNFIKYGTGFIIPSMTDLSTVALTSGFHALSLDTMKAMRRTMKGASYEEIRRLAVASERMLQNQRLLKIADVADIKSMAGIGDKGGIKHNITSPIDRVFQSMASGTTTLSAMTLWNTQLKALAMVEMEHNFASLMMRYDDLLVAASAGKKSARLEIGKLASIGIGQEQARRIQKIMAKHQPQKTDGMYELQIHRWLDEGTNGHAAYEDVLTGLRRTAKRAVMTPGIGDTPLFMSKPFYKTLMQFQTYGFVSVNRHVLPAIQRGATYGDMESILSLAFTAALGTGVIATKDLLRHGEIKERSASAWAYDILDRSGFLMYTTVPSAAVYNWGAWAAGSKERPSRYSQNSNQLSFLFGPTGGTMADIMGAGTNAMYGDTAAAGKHALKLAPWQSFQQIFKHIID